MKRRKNTKERTISKYWIRPVGIVSKKGKTVSSAKARENMRFSASLVVSIAFLLTATLLLLVSLNGMSLPRITSEKKIVPTVPVKPLNSIKPSAFAILDDKELDFQVAIPSDWKGWVYKTGFVKSPVDDSLSDQYVRIFLPDPEKSSSKNLDDQKKIMLTIMKFTTAEWKKLSNGCEKENTFFCETMGKEIARNDESVYSYVAEKNTSSVFAGKYRQVDKVIESFKLK